MTATATTAPAPGLARVEPELEDRLIRERGGRIRLCPTTVGLYGYPKFSPHPPLAVTENPVRRDA